MKNWEMESEFNINVATAKALNLFVKEDVEDSPIGFNKGYHDQFPSTVWVARKDEDGKQCEAWEQMNFCLSLADCEMFIPTILEDLFCKPDWCILNNCVWDYWTQATGSVSKAAAITYLKTMED